MQDTQAQEVKDPQPTFLRKFKPFLNTSLSFLKNLFLSHHAITGIDIGSSFIKIVQVVKTAKGYAIVDYLLEAIPEAGKNNADEKRKFIVQKIRSFLERTHCEDVRIVLWDRRTFIFSFQVPYLRKRDLNGVVSIELKRQLPLQLDIRNVAFGYYINQEAFVEKGQDLQLTCIAAERLVILEQLEFYKQIGIFPGQINVAPDCLSSLLPFCLPHLYQKDVALFALGENSSLLNFYKAGDLVFSREISIGGKQITQSLVKEITLGSGTVSLRWEEAERIKHDFGIPVEPDDAREFSTASGVLRAAQIATLLRPTLERLFIEINRTFIYYAKSFKAPTVQELYLTGGGAHLKNLDKFLLNNVEGLKIAQRLDTTAAINSWQYKGSTPALTMEEAGAYLAPALSICVGKGGRIDLLPQKEKLEKIILLSARYFKTLFPFLLGLMLVLYAFIYFDALSHKQKGRKLEAILSKKEALAKQVRESFEIGTKLGRIKDFLAKEKTRQPLWVGILKELSLITPSEIIFQKIIALPEIQPKEIRLFGRIYARFTILDVALSQYLLTLGESPYFNQPDLITSKTDMYSAVPAADFEISLRLRH